MGQNSIDHGTIRPPRRISVALGRVVFISLVLTGVVVVSFSGAAYNKNATCTACHEIRERMDALKSSPHKGTDCEKCHTMPGWSNKAKDGLKSIGIKPEKCATTAHVSDTRCLRCHSDVSEVVQHKGISIPHKDHGGGQECLLCHADIGHSTGKKGAGLKLEKCRACHESVPCNKCHKK